MKYLIPGLLCVGQHPLGPCILGQKNLKDTDNNSKVLFSQLKNEIHCHFHYGVISSVYASYLNTINTCLVKIAYLFFCPTLPQHC